MWKDPWKDMRKLHRRMNRLFGNWDDESEEEFDKGFRKAWTDFRESENEYLIAVELPGMEKEDIDLEVGEDSIAIKAEKKQEKKQKDEGNYSYAESYSGFARVISLPENADSEKVDAEYKNGVLKIKIGKKKKEKKGNVIRIK